jgi:uncharacterized membrane protein
MPFEPVEKSLALLAGGLQLFLEALSVATVLLGLLATLRQSLFQRRSTTARPGLSAARLRFGSWLSMALEFQLGADIVATTARPNRDNLIQLAVVAVIRTFLNVFLERELQAAQRLGAAPKTDRTG